MQQTSPHFLFFYWTTTSKPASALDWTTGKQKLAGFAQNPECLTEVCLFYWFRRRHSLLLLDSGYSKPAYVLDKTSR
jgi:hypothetical protein